MGFAYCKYESDARRSRRFNGGTAYNKIAIYQDRLKPNSLITTPNSDVIYAMGWLDMKETGPLIIEHPAGLQSLMDDMYHHPLRGPLDKTNRVDNI